MGWTSEVEFYLCATLPVTTRLRRRFTHKGFQNFGRDSRGNPHYNQALDDFEAFERIVNEDGHSRGELVYRFSIWKDNIFEVTQRFLELLETALVEVLGEAWRESPGLVLGSQEQIGHGELAVVVRSDLGHDFEHCFDLRPALVAACGNPKLLYDESKHDGLLCELFFESLGADQDEINHGLRERHLRPDLSQFVQFSAELRAWHAECEPDAFGCDNGGTGVKVRVVGLEKRPELNDRIGIIKGPVDLERQRWPVQVLGGPSREEEEEEEEECPIGIYARRRNLELIDLHTTLPRSTSPAPQTPQRVDLAESPPTPPVEKRPVPKKETTSRVRLDRGLAMCCYWLQGRCSFGSRCHFSHTFSSHSGCQFGVSCKLGHGAGVRSSSAARGADSRGISPRGARRQRKSRSQRMDECKPMFGFDEGCMGFSAAECDELLMQGIKPWDDDAEAALSVLFGADDF